MNKDLSICCYCGRDIDRTSPDYGLTLVDYGVRWWHSECFFMFEPMPVLEELW